MKSDNRQLSKPTTSNNIRRRVGLALLCLGLCTACVLKLHNNESYLTFGRTIATGDQLDIAILGDGYFQIEYQTSTHYTRNGCFSVTPDCEICLGAPESECILSPRINLPSDTISVKFERDGTVSVKTKNDPQTIFIGCIQLVSFQSPSDLEPVGNGLFRQSKTATPPYIEHPGRSKTGIVRQGRLERGTSAPSAQSVSSKVKSPGTQAKIVLK